MQGQSFAEEQKRKIKKFKLWSLPLKASWPAICAHSSHSYHLWKRGKERETTRERRRENERKKKEREEQKEKER